MGLKSERVFWKHIYREIHCAFYNRIVLNIGLNLLLKALVSLAEALDEWYVFLMGSHLSKGLKEPQTKWYTGKNKPFLSTTFACPFTWCEVVSGINAQNKMNHTNKKAWKHWWVWNFSLSTIMLEATWALWKMWRESINIKVWISIFKCGLNLSPL